MNYTKKSCAFGSQRSVVVKSRFAPMLSFSRYKFFFILALSVCVSCVFWQGSTQNKQENSGGAEIADTVPFSTKEPENYQAEIVLTTYAGGEKSERVIFVARNGEKLRYDFALKISFLQKNAKEKFLLHNGKKIYAENFSFADLPVFEADDLQNFLTGELLNQKREAKFENLGAENNLTKYRVAFDDAKANEILFYVDENLKIPVRQEFYSGAPESKSLFFSMELKSFKAQTDDKIFDLPKDFRKVSIEEFQKTVWRDKFESKNE